MNREQILALAEEQGAVANLKQHFNMAGDSIVFTPEELEAFFNAAIESYNAELLKEAGEPVACRYKDHNGRWCFMGKQYGNNEPLYTSDQVAAAILKATKPLGDKLAAAQEENERPPAIDAYEKYMADDKESDPVERLRFFLSLALKGKDWLDVERFIKDVSDQLAKAEQRYLAWEGGEEWEQLAFQLCADECGEESCNELIWEGCPPEPWGERWLKYESEAKRIIQLVRQYAPDKKAEQRVAEWQPISTAPKDVFVLLAGPSGYTTIKTVFTTGRMCSDYHKGRWIDHANDDLTDWGFEPTNWMPLPKAPNGASS